MVYVVQKNEFAFKFHPNFYQFAVSNRYIASSTKYHHVQFDK